MDVFEWLFSIEDKVVFVVGSTDLKDLRNVINGFLEAKRFVHHDYSNPFFPGFQRYVEKEYNVYQNTAKGWNTLITEHSINEEHALSTFYLLIHRYHLSLLK